jgi:hypothetical protein
MSNMQRVAGSLFAKMRDVHNGLYSAQLDVNHMSNRVAHALRLVDGDVNLMTNRLDQVTLQLERLTRQLDEQRRCNRTWFALVVGINVGIYLMLWYMRIYGLYVAYKHEKRPIFGNYTEEVFMWLFVRPWLN